MEDMKGVKEKIGVGEGLNVGKSMNKALNELLTYNVLFFMLDMVFLFLMFLSTKKSFI